MRLALTGRNLEITPALRQLVTRRLAKLDRLLHDRIISAQVVLRTEKHRHKTDVLVQTDADRALSGHGEDGTWQTSIASALTKVEQQAAKVKGKAEARTRRGTSTRRRAAADEDAPDLAEGSEAPSSQPSPRRRPSAASSAAAATPAVRIVRARRLTSKPMRLEDAVLRVETSPGAVLVFQDAALDRVQVLVRRADGHLTLVDPDA